jgi:2-(1,2-epoxy-1,2-dihydrophenyl)acetyl-CoA isomerase
VSQPLLVEHTGGVTTVTLNRPEALNAFTPEMLEALRDLADELADDPAVRCVLVTGAGRAFCAGGDVKGMAARNDGPPVSLDERLASFKHQVQLSRFLYEMPKPTIAAVNGYALGAGLSLALATDIRIAADDAKLGVQFARVGTSGDYGITWFLQRLVGPAKAKELCFSSEIMDAQAALALGLVNRVVPAASLQEEAAALARQFAAGPTRAFGLMKENIAYGAVNSLEETLRFEAANQVASQQTEDHREAARAFVEKRDPRFAGT